LPYKSAAGVSLSVVAAFLGVVLSGQPRLTEVVPALGFTESEVLTLVAGLERYSKHPLSGAVLEAARHEQVGIQDVYSSKSPEQKLELEQFRGVRPGPLRTQRTGASSFRSSTFSTACTKRTAR
jgi:cation transport ATPase